MLPSWIQERIEGLMAPYSSSQLAQAYDRLSQRYRNLDNKRGFQSALETVAYVGARFPATFTCVQRCLDELPEEYKPFSTLDVGCGPGTATLACLDRYDQLQATLLEENSDMAKVGQQLVPTGHWMKENVLSLESFPTADLVLFSYVLNEIPVKLHEIIVQKLWAAANDYLLIITTGTPAGFSQLKSVRQILLQQKAFIVAPCPHAFDCPILNPDWCHFSVRLNRTAQHKNLKNADLNYEDEKYSYLLVSKKPVSISYDRVIKRPQHRSGHGTVDLCTQQGQLNKLPYSKSKSKGFNVLKSLNWGDKFLVI